MSPPDAHLSIHDVKPSTLDRVERLVDVCRPHAGTRIALLIVPGLPWTAAQVDRLRAWSRDGLELAGHGWIHEGPPRSLYHRLHGLVLSRDQAEHLSRSRDELLDLVRRGFSWFGSRDLPDPGLYVPPAWALGKLGRRDLAALPYRWYEVLQGFVERRRGRLRRTPLVGYEADTGFRQRALRVTNGLARRLAALTGRPLRIGLHPRDMELRLAEDLHRDVTSPNRRYLTTAEAMVRLGAQAPARIVGSTAGHPAAEEGGQRPTDQEGNQAAVDCGQRPTE